MLQALSERGDLVIASTLTYKEASRLRKGSFYCPECKEKVIVRAGPKVTPHFAHLPESSCTFGKRGESNYHKRAKLLLFNWLQKQSFRNIYLERHLPQINQRPDILLETNKGKVAVEFQSATITPTEITKRNQGYASENIFPLWILGKNQLRKSHPHNHSYQLNSFKQYFIKQYRKNSPTSLIYFCPINYQFTILNDFYFYRMNKALAIRTNLPMNKCYLPQLFAEHYLPNRTLLHHWNREKERLRLTSFRVHGKEYQFRKWLYEKQLHVEQLPSVIHLPIRSQYKMKAPLWHWQSKLVINLLHPLPIGATVTSKQCQQEIKEYVNKQMLTNSDTIINEYFSYLIQTRLFKQIGKKEWKKTRHFRFHRYIEESLRADHLLINYLLTD